ncbi:MAG: aspartyl protease family protein [Asticcacaulis sp.]
MSNPFRILILALSLTACASEPLPVAEDVTLPATFRNGVVFIKTSVNGAAPVWMLLDNGTTPSAIDLDYAKSLGLMLKSGTGSGTGIGSAKFQFFNTSAEVAAGATDRRIAFSALKLTGITGPDGEPLAGVLGYSFVAGRIVVIDYPHSEVRFAAASAPCACDLAMTLDNDIPAIPVTVAGHKLAALVDTGGEYDLLLTPTAVRLAGLQAWAGKAHPATGSGYAGAQTVMVGSAPDVTVGTITKPGPQALYATFGTSPLTSPVALGVAFLKDYKVTLNYRARTVRFDAAQ